MDRPHFNINFATSTLPLTGDVIAINGFYRSNRAGHSKLSIHFPLLSWLNALYFVKVLLKFIPQFEVSQSNYCG